MTSCTAVYCNMVWDRGLESVRARYYLTGSAGIIQRLLLFSRQTTFPYKLLIATTNACKSVLTSPYPTVITLPQWSRIAVERHGKMPLNSRTVLLNILLYVVGTQLAVTDGGKVHGVLGVGSSDEIRSLGFCV